MAPYEKTATEIMQNEYYKYVYYKYVNEMSMRNNSSYTQDRIYNNSYTQEWPSTTWDNKPGDIVQMQPPKESTCITCKENKHISEVDIKMIEYKIKWYKLIHPEYFSSANHWEGEKKCCILSKLEQKYK